jgi:hypothetical protein
MSFLDEADRVLYAIGSMPPQRDRPYAAIA